ncbi:hypothetical protein L2E82_12032 [Cichorium intybus]|uniref:Uncharacterized protein n=1 Tax=Cichorium intybus TaxID=13427 RepID=A0ACB9GFL9_CICIN|nr:hypothetical protein L2E82_12032 [Cichorium intybus]
MATQKHTKKKAKTMIGEVGFANLSNDMLNHDIFIGDGGTTRRGRDGCRWILCLQSGHDIEQGPMLVGDGRSDKKRRRRLLACSGEQPVDLQMFR